MPDERTKLGLRRIRRNGDRRLLARLTRHAMRVISIEPGAADDKTSERLGELDDERLPSGGRNIVADQDRLANRRQMPETLDDTIDRERRDVGVKILHEDQAGFGGADFGDRGGD